MASQESLLGKLLNDESFLHWLKDKATPEEKEEWGRWLLKDPGHRRVVEKAQKFLNMPFKTTQSRHDKSEQLCRLQKKISGQDKDCKAAKDEE